MTVPVNGLLLFAHGARDPAWALPFEAVARRCREQQPGRPVQLAFLEFMTPNLVQAGDLLAAQACTTVNVVPLFLGAGGHVRKDIPVLMAQLVERHPALKWHLQPTVGESPELVEAMARIALRANDAP
ncbi:MAG: CbiX/SirB N-terminal domain-containing protein [Ideonella sp.]|nr:CbiX/SirB N-terminal domain-containing protein [Ideonella sp.]